MKYIIHPDVEWAAVADDIRLYHGDIGEFRTLNRTGGAIWRLVAEGRDSGEISEDLSIRFGPNDAEPTDIVKRDVDEFLTTLVSAGFLVLASSPPASPS